MSNQPWKTCSERKDPWFTDGNPPTMGASAPLMGSGLRAEDINNVIYPVTPSEKIYVAITDNVSPPDDPRTLKRLGAEPLRGQRLIFSALGMLADGFFSVAGWEAGGSHHNLVGYPTWPFLDCCMPPLRFQYPQTSPWQVAGFPVLSVVLFAWRHHCTKLLALIKSSSAFGQLCTLQFSEIPQAFKATMIIRMWSSTKPVVEDQRSNWYFMTMDYQKDLLYQCTSRVPCILLWMIGSNLMFPYIADGYEIKITNVYKQSLSSTSHGESFVGFYQQDHSNRDWEPVLWWLWPLILDSCQC